MDLQDGGALLQVRQRDLDLAVEPARPEQRRIQDLGTVRRGDDDDAGRRVEPVHLSQQLIERLLALVVGHETAAAPLTDRVDLIDEDDRRCPLARALEEIAHARRAETDEQLDEARAGHREERHTRLARDRARHQRLAGAGRAHHQNSPRADCPDPPEAIGVLEEVDHLGHLTLRAFVPGDVGECRPRPLLVVELRAGAGDP